MTTAKTPENAFNCWRITAVVTKSKDMEYNEWRNKYCKHSLMNEAMARASWNAAVQQTAAKCAKICEELPAPTEWPRTTHSYYDVATLDCGAAIKAHFDTGAKP